MDVLRRVVDHGPDLLEQRVLLIARLLVHDDDGVAKHRVEADDVGGGGEGMGVVVGVRFVRGVKLLESAIEGGEIGAAGARLVRLGGGDVVLDWESVSAIVLVGKRVLRAQSRSSNV